MKNRGKLRSMDFDCPTCNARKGRPCMSRPKRATMPIPPMPMTRVHDARARLARAGCAPMSVRWCEAQSMTAWRRAIVFGSCKHMYSGGAIVAWTEELAKWKTSHDRAVRLGGMA